MRFVDTSSFRELWYPKLNYTSGSTMLHEHRPGFWGPDRMFNPLSINVAAKIFQLGVVFHLVDLFDNPLEAFYNFILR